MIEQEEEVFFSDYLKEGYSFYFSYTQNGRKKKNERVIKKIIPYRTQTSSSGS